MRVADSSVCTDMPANVSCTACIFGEYALTALCTPFEAGRASACIAEER